MNFLKARFVTKQLKIPGINLTLFLMITLAGCISFDAANVQECAKPIELTEDVKTLIRESPTSLEINSEEFYLKAEFDYTTEITLPRKCLDCKCPSLNIYLNSKSTQRSIQKFKIRQIWVINQNEVWNSDELNVFDRSLSLENTANSVWVGPGPNWPLAEHPADEKVQYEPQFINTLIVQFSDKKDNLFHLKQERLFINEIYR